MKKTQLILVSLFALAVFTCTSGVASAISISPKYVGNTMVDLSWTQYGSTDFSKYELCRDGVPITTITDRTVTFYRDIGLPKGITYDYEIRVYDASGVLKATSATSATTGEVRGTITLDTTWTAASSPYTLTAETWMTGDVDVRNGATLTIGSGVVIVINVHTYSLNAISVEEKGVLYADGASFYDGDIEVHDYTSIKNCFFEHARINLHNSNNSIIAGNTVNGSGILLSESSNNNVVSDNTLSNSRICCLDSSSNNVVSDNTLSNISRIYLSSSSNNSITDNTVSNNRHGIYLYSSSNNSITNNTVSNNDGNGIWLSKSSNNAITDNTISNNYHGIYLSSSSNNTVTDNTVSNNSRYGIYRSYSSNNTLYNNYFNNTHNAYVLYNGNNTWNITKTAGTNIVGGPYLGGNYWSDYKGTDLDSDGLGDTLLPYCAGLIKNGGDYHPLIEMPIEIEKIIMLIASPEELPANGMNKSLITAIVANQTGHIAGVNVSFSLDNTSLGKLEPLTAKTNESGIATSNFTAGTIPGVVNVTANESKTHASDSVKIILGMIKINHTSSTYQFIPTPCRNATINFEIKPGLLRDSPKMNISMIIKDKNSKLVYNSSEDPNARINNTTAIWTGKNTTGERVDPRLSNYTVKIVVKYRNMTINDIHEITVLPNRVIVVVDEERMKALYDDAKVDKLMANLMDYCCRNNGTLYNLTKVRHDFNGDPGHDDAFTYRQLNQWLHYPKFVERRLENVTKFMIQNNNVSILLVGNDRVIPFHRETPPKANWEDRYTFVPGNVMWTDYPYSDLNPQDWMPDVALGRLIGDPDLMRSTLENAITQYRSNTALIASCALGLAETQSVGNKFNTTWGFESQNVFKYYEMAGRDDIADITEGGLSFLQRLDGGHTIIYTVNHGNDFREVPGNAMHRFSDHAMKCHDAAGNKFPCCCEPLPSITCYRSHDCSGKVLRPPFEPYKAFLRASNVTNLNGHPFYATIACHGGVTYPDDTVNTNMPLAFLNGSAVGYLGSTAYTPATAGLDFSSRLFDNMRVKNPTGESIKLAKRSMMDANYDTVHGVVDLAMHLYGDPLYTVYVPNDPEEPNGYNISIEDDIIKVTIITYDITTVETAKGDRNLIVIPGADLVSHPVEYVVPEIVVKMSLSPEYDINELDIAAHDKTTIANIKLPLTNPGAIHFIAYGYLGDKMDLPGLYPDKFAEFDVFEDPNGDKNVVFRIFPFQYNENSNEIYLYKNITLSYTTKPAEPKPPVRLSVTNDFESEITAGASTVVGMFIDNYGTGDAKNVNITEEIPDGFNVTFVSNGGTFNTATNIITWEIQSIGYEDFKMLNYELVAPQTVGNYTINTTIEYTDENGTVYPVINISKFIIVSGTALPDLTLTSEDIWFIPPPSSSTSPSSSEQTTLTKDIYKAKSAPNILKNIKSAQPYKEVIPREVMSSSDTPTFTIENLTYPATENPNQTFQVTVDTNYSFNATTDIFVGIWDYDAWDYIAETPDNETLSGTGSKSYTFNLTAPPSGIMHLSADACYGDCDYVYYRDFEVTISTQSFTIENLTYPPTVDPNQTFQVTVHTNYSFENITYIYIGIWDYDASEYIAGTPIPETTLSGSGNISYTLNLTAPLSGIMNLSADLCYWDDEWNLSDYRDFDVNISAEEPDFTITATPPSQTVLQGDSAPHTILLTSLYGFNSPVTLSVAGLPTGATSIFDSNPVTPSDSATLTINTSMTTPTGNYTLTITGVGGEITHQTTVALNITATVEENVTMISATIHNIGTANASNVTVQFFDGDPDAGGIQIGNDQTITSIPAGGAESVSVDWIAEACAHAIYVRVDPFDSIQESNEENNIAFNTILLGTRGDLNNDGKITPADAVIALQIAAGSHSFDPATLAAADVSGDDRVTSLDALMILQATAGAIEL